MFRKNVSIKSYLFSKHLANEVICFRFICDLKGPLKAHFVFVLNENLYFFCYSTMCTAYLQITSLILMKTPSKLSVVEGIGIKKNFVMLCFAKITLI